MQVSQLERQVAQNEFLRQNDGGYYIPDTAYVVSMMPILKEQKIGFPPGILPYIINQPSNIGVNTHILLPAAEKGKVIRRRLNPRKLQGLPPGPTDRDDEFWYYHDMVSDLPRPQDHGFVILQVYDGTQFIRHAESGQPLPQKTPAREFAEGLTRQWLSFRATQGQLGYGWCEREDQIPGLVEHLTRLQTLCFADLVTKARTLWGASKYDQIDGHMRLAADWLGLEDEAWRKQIVAAKFKNCILCKAQLDMGARSCSNCGLLPVKYIEAIEMGVMLEGELEQDPIVQDIIRKMRANRKGKAA